MNSAISRTSQRTVAGVAVTNAILLVYGLFRPDSLDFSVPFLIAPSLALLGTVVARESAAKRIVLLSVWAIVAGLIAVILINELTG
ncbi:MAG: hypothetical protein PVF87_00730 [Acidimicrobiia bacterium]|jgi:hypothetical protein